MAKTRGVGQFGVLRMDGDGVPKASEGVRAVDPRDADRVVVEWLLGSRCNYECSYCPTELHDGAMRWPSWPTVERTVREIAAHYTGRRLTFLLTGGEPTLYARVLDLADLVHEVGGTVAMLSNGSRALDWWSRAMTRVDEVILSFHREFADRDHFLRVAALLAEHVTLQVNLVMLPEHFSEGLDFAESIEAVAPRARVHRKPLMDAWRSVHGYDADQREMLYTANAPRGRNDSRLPPTWLGGDLMLTSLDGVDALRTPIQVLLNDENRWRGWECSAGLETLFIRSHDVYRGACRVGGVLSRLDDDSLVLPTAAIVCSAESCTCIAGVKATKLAPTADERRSATAEVR